MFSYIDHNLHVNTIIVNLVLVFTHFNCPMNIYV